MNKHQEALEPYWMCYAMDPNTSQLAYNIIYESFISSPIATFTTIGD